MPHISSFYCDSYSILELAKKYHCVWRKSASMQVGYQEFIQVLLGMFSETALLLGFLVEKRKLVLARGGEAEGGIQNSERISSGKR